LTLSEACIEETGDFDLALRLPELKMPAEALKAHGCTDEIQPALEGGCQSEAYLAQAQNFDSSDYSTRGAIN
jgi:hypothetical protein